MTTAAGLLAVARGQLGYHESGGSSKFGAWYGTGFDDAPWCDMFVSWCAAQAGAGAIIGKYAYTPYHAEWFNARDQYNRTPAVGAIVFYDWHGVRTINHIDHVGIVESVRSDAVVAIEGNTDDAVMRRVRTFANVAGYGHPAYSAPPPPPPVPIEWTTMLVERLPTIARGASGTHVRTAQGLLCARGPDVIIDGDFGAATETRVKAEQSEHDLPADGVIGPHTWAVLLTNKDFS